MNRKSLRATTVAMLAVGAVCAVPAVAGAATLNGAGTLTYTAAAGHDNDVDIFQPTPGTDTVRVINNDADPITATGTCTEDAGNPGEFECTGITLVSADAGDMDDSLNANGLADIKATLAGGTGDDGISGGSADDTINTGDGDDFAGGGDGNDVLDGGSGNDFLAGGNGDDALRGSAGNDELNPGEGKDDVTGGADFDSASVSAAGNPAPDVSATLDDQPNDGPSGDNIHSDVEDLGAGTFNTGPGGPGNVTIVGSAGSNQLYVFDGKANITGGAGNDSLFGGELDDTINSRDGFFDRVQCGRGADLAIVDSLDSVSSDCETIQSQDVGNANEDKSPTVAFTSPAANGAKVGTKKATTLTATATDDKGISKVQFVDDERVVCEDAVAPYTCAYTPRGTDVGRNTLAAIAIDSSQQTATALRTIRVGRFAPRAVTLKVTPKKDASNPRAYTASGKVNRPAGVTAAQGCKGAVVAVQVKAGKKTISNRKTKLKSNCTFKQRVSFTDPGRLPSNGVLKFTARYQGNSIMTAKKSKTVKARTK